jgi:hypothetical protein
MINKSTISAISFLLISTFYGASASAGVNATTRLQVEVPWGCGVYSPMTNHHCPLVRSEASWRNKGHDTLMFDCTGGTNSRSVTSVMTKNCGRLTMTTFMVEDSAFMLPIAHFAELTYGKGVCSTCKDDVASKKGGSAVHKIKIKPPVGCKNKDTIYKCNPK